VQRELKGWKKVKRAIVVVVLELCMHTTVMIWLRKTPSLTAVADWESFFDSAFLPFEMDSYTNLFTKV